MKISKKVGKGFTLIELLVVIAIIGLLSTLAVIALNNARMKSRDAKRLADIKQVQSALELYFNDNGSYPTNIDNGVIGSTQSYMVTKPVNPSPQNDGDCPISDYEYTLDDTSTYHIKFCLGSDSGSVSAGTRTVTPAGMY